jgi:hypothetical protein
MYGEEGACGLYLIVCKNYDCLNVFFAVLNFNNIKKNNVSICSLFQQENNSKKTKQLLGFKKPRKKIRQNKKAWFSWKRLCIG